MEKEDLSLIKKGLLKKIGSPLRARGITHECKIINARAEEKQKIIDIINNEL